MTGEPFSLRVEKLVYGGEGLGYHNGKPVFVPFVLPGEVVEVIPVEESRKLVRALPEKVQEAAAERIAADCPYFGRCGGCHYQHLSYERQLALKVEILRETLRRLGKIDWPDDIPAHASPPWNYRNRIQLKLGPHPVQAGVLQAGYYRAGSHAICPVEQCPISSPRLGQLVAALARLGNEQALPLSLREADAFVEDSDRTFWLTLRAPRLDFDTAALAETLRTALDGLLSLQFEETSTGRRQTDGLGWIYTRAGAHQFRVSHQSFFQVNHHLVPTLLQRVVDPLGGKTALDLYAGVGLFAGALAERFAQVVAVESEPHAAADLAANAAAASAVETRQADAAAFLRGWKETPDVVVLDPPRAGLGRHVSEALLRLGAARVVYLSCDPATLARDLARLRARYRLTSLELFDLFPQTFHIETLARLELHE